ncbi:MAG: hypothetical protein WC718_09485 [Phycisphaerales bacterium]|jgi:probable HAF family extracellular repeat protein
MRTGFSGFGSGKVAGLMLAAMMTASAFGQGGSFRTIAPDPQFDYAVVQAISANGRYAVVSLQNSTNRPFPLISYRLDLQTGDRIDLIDPSGADLNALAISADGSTIVGYVGGGPLTGSYAFVWSSGEVNVIGGLGTGEINYATGVSNDGSVVVGLTSTAFGDGYSQGWKWSPEVDFTALEDLGTDVLTFSSVEGVSGDGSTVVGYGTIGDFDPDTDDFAYATVWQDSVTPTNIGNLPNPFNAASDARAASDDGSVVVGFGGGVNSLGNYANRSFRWTAAGGMVNLGELPGQPTASLYALDCTADGNTAVGYSIVGGPNTWNAVTWTQAAGWRTLRSQLLDRGITYPADLGLRETYCSADGTVLGGWAYNTTTQKYVGYIATLPNGAACDPDVNQDGNSDQGDVDYLVNVVAGGANPTNIDPDFNGDGNVDQGDIDALINVVAGGECP